MPRIECSKNMAGFLDTIAWSELGPGLLTPETDDGYKVIVGSTPTHPILFDSYAQHPQRHILAVNSDAAGRYQIMGRYATAYARQLGLPDFGPVSQDKIALQLIQECHATHLIEQGQFPQAVMACKSRWASLPGAGYGQHEHSMDNLQTAYLAAGGSIA